MRKKLHQLYSGLLCTQPVYAVESQAADDFLNESLDELDDAIHSKDTWEKVDILYQKLCCYPIYTGKNPSARYIERALNSMRVRLRLILAEYALEGA